MIKKFLLLLFFGGLIFQTGHSQSRGFRVVPIETDNGVTNLYENSYALLIGVSDFTNGWSDLPGVLTDIEAVDDALKAHGFETTKVIDPIKSEIDQAITEFIANYGQGRNDRILIYYAGHGHTVKTHYGEEIGYIVPVDAPLPQNNEALFQSKALEMGTIETYSMRMQSKHVLFLMDACFSGALFSKTRAVPPAISYKTHEPVRQFITSGSADETVPDESIFRAQFVEALKEGTADTDGDGYITGTELGAFLETSVINYSRNTQHPQFGKIRNPNLDKGDFVFMSPGKTNTVSSSKAEDTQSASSNNLAIKSSPPSPTYGAIELNARFGGEVYLNGRKLGTVRANSTVPFDGIETGEYKLEVIGEQNWSTTVTVRENRQSVIRTPERRSVRALEIAAAEWDQKIAANPNEGNLYLMKGQRLNELAKEEPDPQKRPPIYEEMLKNLSKAKELLEQGRRRDRKNAESIPMFIQNAYGTEHNTGIAYVNDEQKKNSVSDPTGYAIAHLINATSIKPNSAISWQVLGQLYQIDEDYVGATNAYKEFMDRASNPEYDDYRRLFYYCTQAKSCSSVLDYLIKAEMEFANSTEMQQVLVDTYFSMNHTDEGISILRKLIEKDPTNVQYHLALGVQYARQYNGWFDNHSQDWDPRENTWYPGFYFDNAMEALNKAIQYRPDHATSFQTIGILYQNHASALYDFIKKLEKDSDDYAIYKEKAEQELRKAQTNYEKAVELDPSITDVWQSLSQVYSTLGMDEKAADAKQKAGNAGG